MNRASTAVMVACVGEDRRRLSLLLKPGAYWENDLLSKPLFEANESLAMLERDDEFSFLSTDAYYLQESAWVTQIVDRVAESQQLNAFELYRLAAGN